MCRSVKSFTMIVLILCFICLISNFKSPEKVLAQKREICSGEAMVTMEAETQRVLYSKNENKKLPMASTTKILTALVAINNCDNLDEKHKIPKEAVGIEGSSIYLKEGEHLTVRDRLYGLMLRSGNDSAVAIAIIVAGSVEKFVELMNEYINDLGLSSTHIVTVNGLHDDEHYTTAYELGVITSHALKCEELKKIVATKEIKISNEFGEYDYRLLKNKNKFLKKVKGADGVKTGFTKKAGRCFVGSVTRNGMQIITVVLNCSPMFEECEKLTERAFSEYKLVKLFNSGELTKIDDINKKSQKVPIIIKNNVYYPLKLDEIAKVSARVNLNKANHCQLDTDKSIGVIDVYLENNLIFSFKIYTINMCNVPDVKDYFHKIIMAF